MSQVVTGEAVALDLRVARLGSRSIAYTLDLVIEIAALLLVLWAFNSLGVGFDENIAAAISILITVGFMVGYPVVFETLWRGRTPGKAALGLRVVRDDGGPIRFRHALVRGVLNLLERPGISFGLVAIVTSLASLHGKRVGDLLAGTVVLQERVPRQRLAPISMPPPLQQWAGTLDLSRLPDDLALAARDFLGRAGQLRPEARARIGNQLTGAVVASITPPPPPGAPGWAILSAVLAERRRREEQRMGMAATAAGWSSSGPGWGEPQHVRRLDDQPVPAPLWSASQPPVGSPPATGRPPVDPGPPYVPAPPYVPPGPAPRRGPEPSPPPEPPDGPFVVPS